MQIHTMLSKLPLVSHIRKIFYNNSLKKKKRRFYLFENQKCIFHVYDDVDSYTEIGYDFEH